MTEALENLRDLQIQAQLFHRRMQDQEVLLHNLHRLAASQSRSPRRNMPSLLAWNGNAMTSHDPGLETELADANCQPDLLSTVVHDYETPREQHDDMQRQASQEIHDLKLRLASAHRIIDNMRHDGKQDRAEIETLQSQNRKLKAMQRKFVADLQAARLSNKQDAHRLGVQDQSLRLARLQHAYLAVRVAFDALRGEACKPPTHDAESQRCLQSQDQSLRLARQQHAYLAVRVAFDALAFRLVPKYELEMEYRRRIGTERAVEWEYARRDDLAVRLAFFVLRLHPRSKKVLQRALGNHRNQFLRKVWRAWNESKQFSVQKKLRAYHAWNYYTTLHAPRTVCRLQHTLRTWRGTTRLQRCFAKHRQAQAWQVWSQVSASNDLCASVFVAQHTNMRQARITKGWRAGAVAARVARKLKQRSTLRAWKLGYHAACLCYHHAEQSLQNHILAKLRTSLAMWREDYVSFARDIEWDAQQHFLQAIWTAGGMSEPGVVASTVYAEMAAEQQAQVFAVYLCVLFLPHNHADLLAPCLLGRCKTPRTSLCFSMRAILPWPLR